MLTLFAPVTSYSDDADLIAFPVRPHRETRKVREERTPVLSAPTGDAWLLVEAIELAEWLGCRVIEAELEDQPRGLRWSRNLKQIWLDLLDPPAKRLATIADALRGEPRLSQARMSPALADYLSPRRAA
jgi:hypothetical protein